MNKDKLKLTFLLTATIIPIALATWLFGVSMEQGVTSTTNKGVLVSPVLELTALDLKDSSGKAGYLSFAELTEGVDPAVYQPRPWQLLFLGTENCNEACQERLFFLRQLHTRLGGDFDRVQRVYVQAEGSQQVSGETVAQMLENGESDMRVLTVPANKLREKLAKSVKNAQDPISNHYIYVADPLGNIMMYFTPENTPEQILKDLEKLLDRSSLG